MVYSKNLKTIKCMRMNVRELIAKLQEFPPEYKIIHRKGHYYHEVKDVTLTKSDIPKVKLE